MFPMVCAVTVGLVAIAAAWGLLYRKLRQAKVASQLKITSEEGIVEKGYAPIGGIEQWISIRGEDRKNPVLFMLHGGPGSSSCIFTPHIRKWERHFTIAQWDQRGAGKTFAKAGGAGSGELTMEQLTRDAIEVAEYLRIHLEQDRLFLLASSMGSTFGLEIARRRPDLFYAYIGTDQNVGMARGWDENYTCLLDRLRAHGMHRGLRSIERIGSDSRTWTARDFTEVAQWTMKSDPAGFRSTIKLLKDAVWYAQGWTLLDVYAFVRGMRFSTERLPNEMVRYDAWQRGTRFEVPILIFQGEDDVVTPPWMAKAYFDEIEAPIKQFEIIGNAGHFAAFLQPDDFLEKLLTYVHPLAFSFEDLRLVALSRMD